MTGGFVFLGVSLSGKRRRIDFGIVRIAILVGIEPLQGSGIVTV